MPSMYLSLSDAVSMLRSQPPAERERQAIGMEVTSQIDRSTDDNKDRIPQSFATRTALCQEAARQTTEVQVWMSVASTKDFIVYTIGVNVCLAQSQLQG